MRYNFLEGASSRTLLLFHGTGGSMNDLIPLARKLDAQASIVAFEGDVEEAGMKRFFKRHSAGVFDEEDLIHRTDVLAETIKNLSNKYEFLLQETTAIGYSNGANIVLSLLLRHGGIVKSAFLHHPMPPYQEPPKPSLENVDVFVGAGQNDPMTSKKDTIRLTNHLKHCQASVHLYWHKQGHDLTENEIVAAMREYRRIHKIGSDG